MVDIASVDIGARVLDEKISAQVIQSDLLSLNWRPVIPQLEASYPSLGHPKKVAKNCQVCFVNGLRPHFSRARSVRCFHQSRGFRTTF